MQVFGLGLPELIIIAVILLLIFGPKRLPGLFRSLGSSMNEFKKGLSDVEDKFKDEPKDSQNPPTQPSSQTPTDKTSNPEEVATAKKDTSA